MPEGSEVRRYADALQEALAGEVITGFIARTRTARTWLEERGENPFLGRRVVRVWSRGKNLIGEVEDDLFFTSHLMMWGRWQVGEATYPPEVDRRMRARITVASGREAVLLSAPVFEVGEGDPFADATYLKTLGPDILPYPGEGAFPASCFVERLKTGAERQIGAALLDQTVAAGIGNYLRAEILFICCLSPFRPVQALTEEETARLALAVAEIARRAYGTGGVTLTGAERRRMQEDASLRYPNASPDWGARHYVFRRTNLPCLVCSTPIRQRRQVTHIREDGEEKERIIYFCPICQGSM